MHRIAVVALALSLGACTSDGPAKSATPVSVASGRFASNNAGLAATWDLEFDGSNGLCLELSTSLGATTSVGCGGDILRIRQSVETYFIVPTVTFSDEGSFIFGMASEKVAELRVQFKAGAPGVLELIDRPGTSLKFFVRQMPLLQELPAIIALDADGNILRRDDRPATSGSPNLIPKSSS